MVVLDLQLDFMILEVFSNLNDSVILRAMLVFEECCSVILFK